MKGNGGIKIRDGKIYVFGVVEGKRYRLSTGKSATPTNISYMKRHHWSVLLKLIDKKESDAAPAHDLASFAREVLALTAHRRDASTQKDCVSKLERMIIPYFRAYSLEDIKPVDVEKWQNALLKKYSSSTVKKARIILGMVLKKAQGNDIVLKNPVEFAENIAMRYTKQTPYSIDEMMKILKASRGWLRVFLHVAFTTGLRPGELMGLQWSDIDFEKGILHVQRSITKGVVKGNTGTKNHNRLVILTGFVLDMLREHRQTSKNEWVFVSSLGGPFSESKAIANRHFIPLLKSIGVPYRGLKTTRHTCESFMRNDGIDTELVMKMIGHSEKVSNAHYYTAAVTPKNVEAINNVFAPIRAQLGHK